MGLTIRLEDERGRPSDQIGDSYNSLLSLIKKIDATSTVCLQFINPYGDTVFNKLQMKNFLSELERLKIYTTNQDEKSLLTKIEELALQCQEKHHLYIKFYGD